MDRVVDNIFVGSLFSLNECENNNIKVIITIFHREIEIKANGVEKYYFFLCEDDDFQDIKQYFMETIRIIEENKNVNILIHCYAGVSRSASLTIAYYLNKYIKLKKMNVTRAIKSIRKKRPIIDPNDGFLKQLNEFHNELLIKNNIVRK